MGAVAGSGVQTRLVKFLPLTHLYVPVLQRITIIKIKIQTYTNGPENMNVVLQVHNLK